MPIGGGTGAPSKSATGVKDPKKQIKNLSKKGYGFGSGPRVTDNKGRAFGPLADPVPLPSDWKTYCMGCGATNILIEEEINL